MPFADNVFISFMFFKFAGYNLPVKKNKGETLSNFYNNYLPKTFLKTHIQVTKSMIVWNLLNFDSSKISNVHEMPLRFFN